MSESGDWITYPFVELGEEEDPVVGHVSHIRVVWLELDLSGSLARNIVGHFDLTHGTALIDGEGGKGSLFILKVNVGRAVNGQKRSDVLGHIIDSHGALE